MTDHEKPSYFARYPIVTDKYIYPYAGKKVELKEVERAELVKAFGFPQLNVYRSTGSPKVIRIALADRKIEELSREMKEVAPEFVERNNLDFSPYFDINYRTRLWFVTVFGVIALMFLSAALFVYSFHQ